jgi:hypothetical protein
MQKYQAIDNVKAFEEKAFENTNYIRYLLKSAWSASFFSHVPRWLFFETNYSSYKWARSSRCMNAFIVT